MKYKISISRFNPEKDKNPYLKSYIIDTKNLKGIMLLDAIEYIRNNIDATIAMRKSCGEGVCGSDGVNINGKNSLACITKLKSLPNHVVIRPLPGFVIIKDLIVNMDNFYNQYQRINPYLVCKSNKKIIKENIQTPKEYKKLKNSYECILCGCCSSSCPSYWWNPEKFLGPAALVWAYRFIFDSRDNNKKERLKALQDAFSIFRCRTIMMCTNSCPKNINPSKLINNIKREMVK